MGWAAEFERQSIATRTKAARVRLEAEGGSWGRPRRMNAADLARARELRATGRSLRDIAVSMKLPRATLARALKAAPRPGAVSKAPARRPP
jgi:DNA invertase Pin-like site-specific DNA recombinase